MECETDGSPRPVISWFKEDENLVNNGNLTDSTQLSKYAFNPNNGSLTINELTFFDNGIYICYASSLSKFPVASINYTIKGKFNY